MKILPGQFCREGFSKVLFGQKHNGGLILFPEQIKQIF